VSERCATLVADNQRSSIGLVILLYTQGNTVDTVPCSLNLTA